MTPRHCEQLLCTQRNRDERGGGTMLTAVICLCVCVAMLVAAWAVGWVGSLHQGRRAADLAALAGAQARVQEQDACMAAGRVARQNGGTLTDCAVEGDRQEFVVRVQVGVELRPRIGGRKRVVHTRAVAGSLQTR